MGMHLVFENGSQQYYRCPWCLSTSFCRELYSHHLCQMTLILNFFEHELGNSSFPVMVLLPLAAVEDTSACWRTLKCALSPLVHMVTRQQVLSFWNPAPRGDSIRWEGTRGALCMPFPFVIDPRLQGLVLYPLCGGQEGKLVKPLPHFILQPCETKLSISHR